MTALARNIYRATVLIAMIAVLPACERKHPSVPEAQILELDPPSARVAPGHTQQFAVNEWGGAVVSARWSVRGVGYITDDGLYTAPYVVEVGRTDTIEASLPSKRVSTVLTASVILRVGVFPGADSCRGPDQGRLPNPGEYVYVDSLPEALTIVHPIYPDSARAHGIEGTVIVRALVCVTGRVLDVGMVASIPELDAASMDAVRQWVFSPAAKNGQPVAVWVHVPLRFTLHGPAIAGEVMPAWLARTHTMTATPTR